MSVPNWRRNAQLVSTLDTTDTTVGIYRGTAGDLSVVSFGSYLDSGTDTFVQSQVSVKSSTRYRPTPGEPVVLTWTNGRLKLTGPARAKSSTGIVKAVGNPKLIVTCDGNDYSLYYAVSLTGNVAVGDTVAIDWDGNYVKDKVTGSDVTPDTPKLTSDQKPFTLNFFAKQSGSRKSFNPPGAAPSYSKWWTQDVIADDDNVSGWFYGNVLRKTLRDDAYISSVEIYLPVRSTKGALPKIGRHTQDTRPSDNDSLSVQDAAPRRDRSGWVKLPTEWAETWRSNPGGVALDHGGTTVYKGIQANRQSGKLRIRGRQ